MTSVADESDPHRARVTVWIGGAARDATPTQLLALFERAIGAIWGRARVTLGDVTLTAIVDRVLYTTAARFPVLGVLAVEGTGVRFDELRARIDDLDTGELVQGIQFAMVELLTVLGHLTADILTPALHSELSRVTLDGAVNGELQQPVQLDATHKKLVRRA